MKTIWKFKIPSTTYPNITMPTGAEILSVGVQNNEGYVWVRCSGEKGASMEIRKFVLVGTGRECPGDTGEYLGTIHTEANPNIHHVNHLFERIAR